MNRKDKDRHVKVTLIAPCQRCGTNHVADIKAAEKFKQLTLAITQNTELETKDVFGMSLLICKGCTQAHNDFVEARKTDVDLFINNAPIPGIRFVGSDA
jgi:uncharacterized protein YcbX